jgi:hypothetical protein
MGIKYTYSTSSAAQSLTALSVPSVQDGENPPSVSTGGGGGAGATVVLTKTIGASGGGEGGAATRVGGGGGGVGAVPSFQPGGIERDAGSVASRE